MSDNLKKKTLTALIWSFVDKFGQQFLYFVTGIILAIPLNPVDLGKMALLAVFVALSSILIDSGFGSALIRKKEATDADYSTIFYFNIGVSLIFYLILFALAPFIESYSGGPGLAAVARVSFLSIVFLAFGMIQQTRLIKYIQFTQLARINIISLFCSSVFAVITAFMGWGVWALVIQSLGMAIVKSVLLWIYGRWRPKWIFRVASMKEFFGYSSSLIGTGVLNTIFNNIYPWLIGKGYSTQAVGYYNQANKFQDMPSALIANIFRSVAFPVLSSINDDRERMIRVFGKYIRTVSFIIFPIMFLLMLVSQPLISILLPEKWAPSIPLMQVLCISGAFSPFIILYYDLFNAVGRSDINLKMEIFKKIFFIIGILVCFKYSIMALMWLWVVYTLCSLIATMFLAHKYVNYTMGSFFFDIFPCLSISLIIAAMSSLYYLVFQDRWLLLVTISGTFGLLYIIAARLFQLEMWHECLQLFKKKVLTNGK